MNLVRLAALTLLAAAGACASFSGYDPSRYENAPAPTGSVDPETEPLPSAHRPLMLDPRSPRPDAGSAGL